MNRPARLHELEPRGKIERPGGGVGREFPQRKPGSGGDGEIAGLSAQGRQGSETVDEKRRLAVGRLGEFIQRPFEGETRQRTVEDGVRLGEQSGGGGRMRAQFAAHADGL